MNETSRAWHTAATSPCRWPQCIRVALGHQGRPRTPGTGQGKGSSEFTRSPGRGRKLDKVATWGWGWWSLGHQTQHPSPSQGIITDLISNTMLSCQESWAFLTDGFPWKLKQAKELERIVSDPRVCENVVKCGATLPPHLGWRSEGIRLGRAVGGGRSGGVDWSFRFSRDSQKTVGSF